MVVRGELAGVADGDLELRRCALDALSFDEDREGDDEPFDGLHHSEPGLVEVVVLVGHASRESLRAYSSTSDRRLSIARNVRSASAHALRTRFSFFATVGANSL